MGTLAHKLPLRAQQGAEMARPGTPRAPGPWRCDQVPSIAALLTADRQVLRLQGQSASFIIILYYRPLWGLAGSAFPPLSLLPLAEP